MSESIEFRHLRYIAAIAETGSFTKASEKLFLSQPSLSKQIKDIETDIGFPIFLRTHDGVIPTPVGQVIVDYALATLHSRTSVFTMAKQIFLGKVPALRLGFTPFVNPRLLKSFRHNYQRQFPKCALQLSGCDTVHVLQRLERGELDCALLSLPVAGSDWIVNQIASTPLVVCMRADDALTDRSQVTLKDVADRLTVFRDPEVHPSAHARLVEMLSDAGHRAHISCSGATPRDLQLLVRDGYGLALVSEDSLLESDITTRRIAGITWTSDTAFIYHRSAVHPALPFIQRHLLEASVPARRKEAQSERSQLALTFEYSA